MSNIRNLKFYRLMILKNELKCKNGKLLGLQKYFHIIRAMMLEIIWKSKFQLVALYTTSEVN